MMIKTVCQFLCGVMSLWCDEIRFLTEAAFAGNLALSWATLNFQQLSTFNDLRVWPKRNGGLREKLMVQKTGALFHYSALTTNRR